jgi:hypothetical protein
VIGILDQKLQLSERHRVWQAEEMREMQRRTNYDGSHHGIPARGLGPSGMGDESSGSHQSGTLFNSLGCRNEQTNVQILNH